MKSELAKWSLLISLAIEQLENAQRAIDDRSMDYEVSVRRVKMKINTTLSYLKKMQAAAKRAEQQNCEIGRTEFA